jgi:S-formylglutathione hydrolase FrmB
MHESDWSSMRVAGHPVELYLPAGRAPALGLVFLHGIGCESLRGNEVYRHLFDELQLACFCPMAGPTWWTNHVTAAFDPQRTAEQWLLGDVLPYLEREFGLVPPRLGLFGVSMGGQGALRLAFKKPALFPVVAGISSAIEYNLVMYQDRVLEEIYASKEQCRQDTALLQIDPHAYPSAIWFCCDPTDDPWYRGNDRLHEKLAALSIPHECDLTTQAGGHSWVYFNAMAARAVRFLHRGLVEQGRRLL